MLTMSVATPRQSGARPIPESRGCFWDGTREHQKEVGFVSSLRTAQEIYILGNTSSRLERGGGGPRGCFCATVIWGSQPYGNWVDR